MPVPVSADMKRALRRSPRYSVIYFALLLLSFHWAMVTYVNSTFLERYVTGEVVGLLYTVAASLTIFAFLFISRVLGKLGNYRLTISLALLEFFALVGMAFGNKMEIVVPLFVLHNTIIPLLLYNIDVFFEEMSGADETSTGGRRGFLLVIMSIAGALAPLLSGLLIDGSDSPRFEIVYLVSAATLIPFGYIIARNFRTFSDPPYRDLKIMNAIRNFWMDMNMRMVFLAQFLLQIFFSWMIIYVPLYLATVIGFHWDEIGLILFIGLTAYILLEYPIGEIADRYIGEKEMMAAGFLIMAISTGWIAFIGVKAVVPWAVSLFLTRVGASLVETTTESYFFKHTRGRDANIIGFFRITRPLAYVAGALLGSFSLLYLPFAYIFLVLGAALIPGIALALALKDTR